MTELQKANLQSWVRGVIYASAGAWMAKHPEWNGVVEGFIALVSCGIWTFLDNKAKHPPTGPEKITVTLG